MTNATSLLLLLSQFVCDVYQPTTREFHQNEETIPRLLLLILINIIHTDKRVCTCISFIYVCLDIYTSDLSFFFSLSLSFFFSCNKIRKKFTYTTQHMTLSTHTHMTHHYKCIDIYHTLGFRRQLRPLELHSSCFRVSTFRFVCWKG